MPDAPIWIEGTTDADGGKHNKHREGEGDFKSIEHVVSANHRLHSRLNCRNQAITLIDLLSQNQPLLPESRKVQSKTNTAAAAAVHPTADQEISQREPLVEKIFRREKATRKRAKVIQPILAHSRHPVSTLGRLIR